MNNQREIIVNKFKLLSDKYHKLSLIFYELSQSLNIELKPIENNRNKIREYLRDKLNLDYNKIINISNSIKELSIRELKGGLKENEI